MTPEMAIAGLQAALDRDETHTVFADIDWDRFAPAYSMSRPRALLNALPDAQRALRTDAGSDRAEALRARLTDLTEDDQERLLLDTVRTQAADVLGHRPDQVRAAIAFKDLGFDSMASLNLRNRLNEATGLALPTTVVFEHATPLELARRMRADLLPGDAEVTDALTQVNRLERAVEAMAPDADARAGVIARLRALLWKYDQTGSGMAEATDDDALMLATDEEMFDIVNKEIGIS